MMKKNTLKGFTLIELMVVIGIIAVLSSILVPQFFSHVEEANNVADAEHARNICTMLQARDAIYGDLVPSNPYYNSGKKTTRDNNPDRGYVYVDKNEVRVSSMQVAQILEEGGYIVNAAKGTKKSGHEYVYGYKKNSQCYAKIKCKSSKSWDTYQVDFFFDDNGNLAFSYSAKKGTKSANDAAATEAFAKYCQGGSATQDMEIGSR